VLLGDELDSPRGRIYLIKDMLEHDRPATEEVVKHIDRCLSCLACMTTCPSGVHYMHLVDHARAHIEATYRRPWPDRLMRALLARVLPYPGRFRAALTGGWLAGRLIALVSPGPRAVTRVEGQPGLGRRLIAMLRLMPARLPARSADEGPRVFAPQGVRKARVALLQGCAQAVLAPSINAAAIRLLTRLGIEVVLAKGEGCCGSLVHHMGREQEALAQARINIAAWTRELDGEGLDAILITASGCGTTVKDYGFMLRNDPDCAKHAARIATLAQDISEFLAVLDIDSHVIRGPAAGLTVAYQSACSLQHGQKITRQPKDLLAKCGFTVRDVAEGHLCCGSAGTYNILQPELARRLRDRKVENLARTGANIIATGNIGCMTQLAPATSIPVVHTVELVDWACGGPPPKALEGMQKSANSSRRIAVAT
jgi:glycolate oxidase iron-sulfur subunit